MYERAIELNPKCHEALINLSVSYQQEKEDFLTANEFAFKALELVPNKGDVLFGIGYNYRHLKEYRLAVHYCLQAIEKKCDEVSTMIEAHEVLSESYRHLQMYREAI